MSLSVGEKLKDNYSGYYASGVSEWRWLGALDKAANIAEMCRALPRRDVLEIGSGDGSILQRLSDLKFAERLHSVEISETAVRTIQSRKIPSLVECKLFDGYSLPFPDKHFDLVVLTHIVEHLEHPRKMLYEAARVGRAVFLEVPLEDNLRLPKDYTFSPVGHINAYSPKTFRRLVQTCDLEILSEKVTNPSYRLYAYKSPRTAMLRYLPKQALLKLVPPLATLLATYHFSLLCRPR